MFLKDKVISVSFIWPKIIGAVVRGLLVQARCCWSTAKGVFKLRNGLYWNYLLYLYWAPLFTSFTCVTLTCNNRRPPFPPICQTFGALLPAANPWATHCIPFVYVQSKHLHSFLTNKWINWPRKCKCNPLWVIIVNPRFIKKVTQL